MNHQVIENDEIVCDAPVTMLVFDRFNSAPLVAIRPSIRGRVVEMLPASVAAP
jgi:hypothetical protein